MIQQIIDVVAINESIAAKANGTIYTYSPISGGFAEVTGVDGIALSSTTGGSIAVASGDISLTDQNGNNIGIDSADESITLSAASNVTIDSPDVNINGNIFVAPHSAAEKPLLIKGKTSQSANFFEIQASDSTPLAYWDTNWCLNLRPKNPGGSPAIIVNYGDIWCFGQNTNARFLFGRNTSVFGGFVYEYSTNKLFIAADSTLDTITVKNTTEIGICNTSPVAQLKAKNSSGTIKTGELSLT